MNIIEPSEAEFQDAVLDLALINGFRYYHTHDSRRSPSGFPDLVLARPPFVIFAELKRASGEVSPTQKSWLEALGCCTHPETYLWRPDDFSTIETLLDRRRTA